MFQPVNLAVHLALASLWILIDAGLPLPSHRSPHSSFMMLLTQLTFQFTYFKGPECHISWKDQGVADLLQLFSILKIVRGFRHLLFPMVTEGHLKRVSIICKKSFISGSSWWCLRRSIIKDKSGLASASAKHPTAIGYMHTNWFLNIWWSVQNYLWMIYPAVVSIWWALCNSRKLC